LIFLVGCVSPVLEQSQNFNFREITYLGPLNEATNKGDGVIHGKTSDRAVKEAVLPPLKSSLSSFRGEVPYAFDLRCRVQLPTKFTQYTSLITNAFLLCEYQIRNTQSGAKIVENRPVSSVILVTSGMEKSTMLKEMGKKLTVSVLKDLARLSK
jgi:hypothetical protein